MKLKKVASLCSKTKIFCLYDREESGGEVSQWLGDSSAIYPITGLPYMDEENIYSMFDISAKQQEKIIFRHQRAPEGINLSDTDPTEHRIDEESLSLVYERETPQGMTYIVAKTGLFVAAVIMPYSVINDKFVYQLSELAQQCRRALEVQKMARPAAEPADETQYRISIDESTGEIINFPGETEAEQ